MNRNDIFKKNEDEIKNFDKLDDLQSKVKQIRLVEKLDKQGFHYNVKELFERITKTSTDTSKKLLEETRFTEKATVIPDEPNKYVETSESMNENGVNFSSLIRVRAKLLVPKTDSQFRLLDDFGGDNWNDFKMNGEKLP